MPSASPSRSRAVHKIGAFEIGLGGNLQEQFTNDAINGVTVASVPGTHGTGNRVSDLSVGPVVGHDFGSVALKAYWLRDVYARNTAGGNRFYVRLDVPLISGAATKTEALDTGGP